MKTYKLIFVAFVTLFIVSCDTYHQVNTRVDSDGSIVREIYAYGDSAFMAGNPESNPFLFVLNDNWEITRLDSVRTRVFFGKKTEMNVRAYICSTSLADYSKNVEAIEYMQPLVLPVETFDKKFRWFYTYYTYRAVYANISDMLPVPLNKYLTEEEQRIFLQGDAEAFAGMNGIEQFNVLDGITDKFEKWYRHCEWEVTLEAFAEELSRTGEKQYISRLKGLRDKLIDIPEFSSMDTDTEPRIIASALDKYLGTDFFAGFYLQNNQSIDAQLEHKAGLLNLFAYKLAYGLEMPGKVITANTQFGDDNSLLWKVDAYRFMAYDYVLEAESRTYNVWAFVVTFVLLIGGVILIRRKRY